MGFRLLQDFFVLSLPCSCTAGAPAPGRGFPQALARRWLSRFWRCPRPSVVQAGGSLGGWCVSYAGCAGRVGREEAPGGGSFAVWVCLLLPSGFFFGADPVLILVLVPGLCEAVHYTLFSLDRTLLLWSGIFITTPNSGVGVRIAILDLLHRGMLPFKRQRWTANPMCPRKLSFLILASF